MITVSTDLLWALCLFLLGSGAISTVMMVMLLRRAWRQRRAERNSPLGAPERVLADDEWVDGLIRLVLGLTTTGIGAIFTLGLMFGELRLEGVAGFILAAIFATQGGARLAEQVHSLRAHQRLLLAIRLSRVLEEPCQD